MIIQFYTPKGTVEVDSDTITDAGLSALSMTRNDLERLIGRDLQDEIDDIKARVEKLENK